jgi:hypothetical protein
MAVIVREMTDCYKCEAKVMAEVGQVHPLCADCQESFDDWFQRQLTLFKN